MDIITSVKSLFLFDNTDFESLEEQFGISEKCIINYYLSGDTVMSLGNIPGLPVMLEGKAEIRSGAGEKAAVLRYIEPGDTFGAASVFLNKNADSTYVVAVDDSTLLFIPKEQIETLIANVPQTAFNYISFLSDRTAFLNKRISAFSRNDSESKLAAYLLSVDEDFAEISEGYKSLSKNLGMSRASLYRVLDSMTDNGIIEKDTTMIYIKDKNKLKKIMIGEKL